MSQLSAGLHLALVTAKFGLTGGVAVALASWLVPKDMLTVAFVALLCIQPSLVTGLKAAKEQILASGLGAVSTLCFLLVFPINPWTVGAGVAATYAVTTRLRWGYSALVVALFSSLYMTLLVQATHIQTVILRFQAVLLGVAVALLMNAIFSPVFTQMNLAVRIQRSVATVRQQLAALRAALVANDAAALEAGLATFQDTFRHLGAVKDDLADLRRELRLPGRPGRRSFSEVYFSDRCVRELELITHHAQDVAMASQRLLGEAGGPSSTAALGTASEALLQAVDALDLVQEGRYDRAEAIAESARQALHRFAEPNDAASTATPVGFSPRLVLAFALIQLHGHLAELLQAATWLDEARRDPDSALQRAATDAPGGMHATER